MAEEVKEVEEDGELGPDGLNVICDKTKQYRYICDCEDCWIWRYSQEDIEDF